MIELTAEDVFNSINYFDEIGIEQAFNAEIDGLQEKPFMFLRALVFVERKHAGCTHDEAAQFSKELTIGDLQEYFPDEGLEFIPESPVTEQGKDESVSETEHVILPDSV